MRMYLQSVLNNLYVQLHCRNCPKGMQAQQITSHTITTFINKYGSNKLINNTSQFMYLQCEDVPAYLDYSQLILSDATA